jgi:small subunit ribosomal protein S4
MKTIGSKAHATLLRKLNVPPGQPGSGKRRKTSEYGRQLREKQKLKMMFGLAEKQLSNYFAFSIRQKGNTGGHLLSMLEKRLDNVVYRLGLAPTRASARQLVNHKHITVNGKIVSVASYQTRMNDVVTFADEKSAKIPAIETSMNREDAIIPAWLERNKIAGKVVAAPDTQEVEKIINLRLVVEFYSK